MRSKTNRIFINGDLFALAIGSGTIKKRRFECTAMHQTSYAFWECGKNKGIQLHIECTHGSIYNHGFEYIGVGGVYNIEFK